jgi:hypothetical protein
MKLDWKPSRSINNSVRHQGTGETVKASLTVVQGNFGFRPPVSPKAPLLMLSRAFITVFILSGLRIYKMITT